MCGPSGYAFSKGYKYCKKFQDFSDRYKDEAKVWIDNVRKCVMKKLTPNIDLSCDELQKYAYKVHADCYIKPEESSKSFCEFFQQRDFNTVIELLKTYELQDFLSMDAVNMLTDVMSRCARENLNANIKGIESLIMTLGEVFKQAGNSLLMEPIKNLVKEIQNLFNILG